MPKVSVIIPVYGVERYIERCARSLFAQTLDDIEYLFIDDCTPDGSIEVLRRVLNEYPERMSHVVIHKMERNSGQAAVRRWGMQHATGDYIIHCDSDDWINSHMYEKLWKKAEEGQYDIVRCNFTRTDGVNENLCRQIPVDAYDDKFKLLSYVLIGSSMTSLCDKLIRRSIIQNNDIEYPIYDMQEDAALVTQLIYFSNKIAFLPEVLYYYYNNMESKSHRRSEESFYRRLEEVKANANLVFHFLEEKGVLEQYKEEIICKKYNVRSHLLGLPGNKRFYKEWYNLYPEIDGKVFSSKKMYLYDKVNYALVKCKLYTLLYKHIS